MSHHLCISPVSSRHLPQELTMACGSRVHRGGRSQSRKIQLAPGCFTVHKLAIQPPTNLVRRENSENGQAEVQLQVLQIRSALSLLGVPAKRGEVLGLCVAPDLYRLCPHKPRMSSTTQRRSLAQRCRERIGSLVTSRVR